MKTCFRNQRIFACTLLNTCLQEQCAIIISYGNMDKFLESAFARQIHPNGFQKKANVAKLQYIASGVGQEARPLEFHVSCLMSCCCCSWIVVVVVVVVVVVAVVVVAIEEEEEAPRKDHYQGHLYFHLRHVCTYTRTTEATSPGCSLRQMGTRSS